MEAVVLRNRAEDGTPIEASFLPDKGMNMISFRRGDIEVIDQSTRDLFEERYAGLGAIIGPHFHHRRLESILPISDESRFPHIARVKAKGIKEPFSHGIARYAPWKFEATESILKGTLTGKDEWNGVPLSALEGQNFTMVYKATLYPENLQIELSVVSEADSLVGLHFYYMLPEGKGKVVANVQGKYLNKDALEEIPSDWPYHERQLRYDLSKATDYGFYPFPNPLEGAVTLETSKYLLDVSYTCPCQENIWQLYHPEGASFVCIEPISSRDPRHPNLTVSSLNIKLKISPPNKKGKTP